MSDPTVQQQSSTTAAGTSPVPTATQGFYPDSLADSLGALIAVLSPDECVSWVNRACTSVTGFSLDHLKGKPFVGALTDDTEQQRLERAIAQVKSNQKTIEFDCFTPTDSGELRRIKWSFTYAPRADGKGPWLIGAGTDVTELFDEIQQLKRTIREQNSSLDSSVRTERRNFARRSFLKRASIAPYDDGQTPRTTDYRTVLCQDISVGGFAFYSPMQPEYSKIVAVLGSSAKRCSMVAQVVHVTPTQLNNRAIFLIGCQFVGRLSDVTLADEDLDEL